MGRLSGPTWQFEHRGCEEILADPYWEELMDGVHRPSKEGFKALEQNWGVELTGVIPDHRQDSP